MQGQGGLWDVEERLKELSAEGDPLEKLASTVDLSCSVRFWPRPCAGLASRRAGGLISIRF